MEILITHLTRMDGDRVCVAGLTEDGEHVRPVARTGHLTRGDAAIDFQLGNVVRLGNPRHAPENGMPEDWLIDVDDSYAVRTADDAEIHERLDAVAVDSLAKAFAGLEQHGHNRWAAPPGRIFQSLAVVRAHAWRLIPQPQWERAVLGYRDAGLPAVTLPVGDLRLFPEGHELDFGVLQQMMAFLRMRDPVLVCVGLSRPWANDDGPELHWTQANTLWPDRASLSEWLREAGRERLSRTRPPTLRTGDQLREFFDGLDAQQFDGDPEEDWATAKARIAASRTAGLPQDT